MASRKKTLHGFTLTEQNQADFLLDLKGMELNVKILNESEAVETWINDLLHNSRKFIRHSGLVVGLSLGIDRSGSLSTVHVSVARTTFIIQLKRILAEHGEKSILKILCDFFSDDRVKFVGIDIGRHARILQNSGIKIRQIYDPKDYLSEENKFASYKEIAMEANIKFGFDLISEVTNCDWSSLNLDENQISQAAAEAFVSLKIGVKLFKEKRLDEEMKVQEVEDPSEVL